MENMFSGKSEKQIPKTFSECTNQDATVTNLHLWSERLENWGKILFYVLIVIGIFSSISDAISAASVSDEIEAALMALISSALSWGLYAFIEYCAYHVLALLISALASITQNTIISANVALFEAAQKYPHSVQAATPSASTHTAKTPVSVPRAVRPPVTLTDTWVCNNCGTSNSTNYGQCKKCGQYKS